MAPEDKINKVIKLQVKLNCQVIENMIEKMEFIGINSKSSHLFRTENKSSVQPTFGAQNVISRLEILNSTIKFTSKQTNKKSIVQTKPNQNYTKQPPSNKAIFLFISESLDLDLINFKL